MDSPFEMYFICLLFVYLIQCTPFFGIIDVARIQSVQERVGELWRQDSIAYTKVLKEILSSKSCTPEDRSVVLNCGAQEASLIILLGAQKTIDLLQIKEHSLSTVLVSKDCANSMVPTLANIFRPFISNWSRHSNELGPMLNIANSALFSCTGPQGPIIPSTKSITEAVKGASTENRLKVTHCLGSTTTRTVNDDLQKEEEILNAIPDRIDVYMKDKLKLSKNLQCPTDQIRDFIADINAKESWKDVDWNPELKKFIIIILVWIIDNVNIPHTSELDSRTVMENLISIMIVVKKYAMSYNDMVAIVGRDGLDKNTLIVDRDAIIRALDIFKKEGEGSMNERLGADIDLAENEMQSKMLDMFSFILQDDMKNLAQVQVMKRKFFELGFEEKDVEGAYQDFLKKGLHQHRSHERSRAFDANQSAHLPEEYFFVDLIKADSNNKEAVKIPLTVIQERSRELWDDKDLPFPKDPTIVVNDHQLFKIATVDILLNDPHFHDGGTRMLFVPGFWHNFALNAASVAQSLSPTVNNTFSNLFSDKPDSFSGIGTWQATDYVKSVGLRRAISDIVMYYHLDVMVSKSDVDNDMISSEDLKYIMENVLQSKMQKVQVSKKDYRELDEWKDLNAILSGLKELYLLPNLRTPRCDKTNLEDEGSVFHLERLYLLQACMEQVDDYLKYSTDEVTVIREVKRIRQSVKDELEIFLDAEALNAFILKADIPWLNLYLDGSIIYNVGMDSLRSGNENGMMHTWTSLMPLYTLSNKVNYLPLALFCRAIYYGMTDEQKRVYRFLGYTGNVIGHLKGIDELLEMTLNLIIKTKYKGVGTPRIKGALGNMTLITKRVDDLVLFSSNTTCPFLQEYCTRTTENNRVDLEAKAVVVIRKLVHSWRDSRARKDLAKWFRPPNDFRISFGKNLKSLLEYTESQQQLADETGHTTDELVTTRVIFNSNLLQKSPQVTEEERNYKSKSRLILNHACDRLKTQKEASDNAIIPEGDLIPVWTPYCHHVIGMQDKLLSDEDDLNRQVANLNNSAKNSSTATRIVKRAKKGRDVQRHHDPDVNAYVMMIGAYFKQIKSTGKYVLSHLDLLQAVSMIFNDLKIPVSLTVSHSGVQSFPAILNRSKVEKNFTRIGNGFTHILFHQNHLMTTEVAYKGGGTSIDTFAMHIMAYLVDTVLNNHILREIWIFCHDFGTIERQGNCVFVDSHITHSGILPNSFVLKKNGQGHIGPKHRNIVMKREEFYQWTLTYLIHNFEDVLLNYLQTPKKQKEKDDLRSRLQERIESGQFQINFENYAHFEWSGSDELYKTHTHTNELAVVTITNNLKTTAPNAAHRMVSKLTTCVNQFLSDSSDASRESNSDKLHFCLVGDDLNIPFGVFISIVQNESTKVEEVPTWVEELTQERLRVTYRHSNFLIKIDGRLLKAIIDYKKY